LRGGQEALELVFDELFDVAADFLVLEGLANAVDDLLRRDSADVGEIQPLFQLVEKALIDGRPVDQSFLDNCPDWPCPF